MSDIRKCSKCEMFVRAEHSHRFPKLGKKNVLRSKAWAKYCWPEKEFTNSQLMALYTSHKLLCKKHFTDSAFMDVSRNRLRPYSIPGSEEYRVGLLASLRQELVPYENEEREIVREDCQESLRGHKMLCQKHFKDNDFTDDSKRVPFRKAVSFDTITEQPPLDIDKEINHVTDEFPQDEPAIDEVHSTASDDPEVVDLRYDDPLQADQNVPDMDNMAATDSNQLHPDIKCESCKGDIVGFRYTCLQCEDVDLCGGCEAQGGHRSHYMLRVPSPRPQAEIHRVLETVRKQLPWLDGSTTGNCDTTTEVKDEIEMGPEEEICIDMVDETVDFDADIEENVQTADSYSIITEDTSTSESPSLPCPVPPVLNQTTPQPKYSKVVPVKDHPGKAVKKKRNWRRPKLENPKLVQSSSLQTKTKDNTQIQNSKRNSPLVVVMRRELNNVIPSPKCGKSKISEIEIDRTALLKNIVPTVPVKRPASSPSKKPVILIRRSALMYSRFKLSGETPGLTLTSEKLESVKPN